MIAGLPERRQITTTQVQFRNELWEFQKRVNYQIDFDRLQGSKRLTALQPDAKSRMKERQQKTRCSLNGEPAHAIYKTRFCIYLLIYRTWNLTEKEKWQKTNMENKQM